MLHIYATPVCDYINWNNFTNKSIRIVLYSLHLFASFYFQVTFISGYHNFCGYFHFLIQFHFRDCFYFSVHPNFKVGFIFYGVLIENVKFIFSSWHNFLSSFFWLSSTTQTYTHTACPLILWRLCFLQFIGLQSI